ncbi:hypothetical protein VP1G_05150 [Cytospora mali]|uniref:ER membrane protein complex subunit 3 n=1 Tax=Cytospora mali TaxID=578113 RepID=A0A194V204_CYTMA|nr:hypothetical protein VP1G_05150 [Valsa mali var. pyri (nom. inval.)]
MAQVPVQTIHRDPQLFYWILFPITIVMVLTGILRHYATVLLAATPKAQDLRTIREQRSLAHGIQVRQNFHVLSKRSFNARRDALTAAYESGSYLKAPENIGQAPPNPMTDPNAMEGMMGAMKGQMAMIIPNTLIMSWINAFFSGYVISTLRRRMWSTECGREAPFFWETENANGTFTVKLPFPLTIKFKSMLQAGVATKDMDPRWMSSVSWYFLCIFGLQPVFNFILGSDNAANQMAQQMGQMGSQPGQQMFGPGVDPNKQFLGEAENLAVIEHYSVLDTVEDRLLEERASQTRLLHGSLDDIGRFSLLLGLLLVAGRGGRLRGCLVVPLLADDGQADSLVDIPVHRTCLVVVPDPQLLVVVELATLRELLGLDNDVAEELCPDVDALRRALGYPAHDDFALEGAENY